MAEERPNVSYPVRLLYRLHGARGHGQKKPALWSSHGSNSTQTLWLPRGGAISSRCFADPASDDVFHLWRHSAVFALLRVPILGRAEHRESAFERNSAALP